MRDDFLPEDFEKSTDPSSPNFSLTEYDKAASRAAYLFKVKWFLIGFAVGVMIASLCLLVDNLNN